MPISAPLVGLWDLYAGATLSELMLRADGGYVHRFGGGDQGHWGSWSLDVIDGHAVIVLTLTGFQPSQILTPSGMQPVQWPAREQLAISSVQPNQVSFYGRAVMVRRAPAVAAPVQKIPLDQPADATAVQTAAADATAPVSDPSQAAGGATAPGQGTDGSSQPTATSSTPAPSGSQGTQGSPAQQPAAVSPGAVADPTSQVVGGIDLSVLGGQGAAPQVHAPAVLNMLQQGSFAQPGQLPSQLNPPVDPETGLPVAPYTKDQWTSDQQSAIDRLQTQQTIRQMWQGAESDMALSDAKQQHAINQKWIDFASG